MAIRKKSWHHVMDEADRVFSEACPDNPDVAAQAQKSFQRHLINNGATAQEALRLLKNEAIISALIKSAEKIIANSFQAIIIGLLRKIAKYTDPRANLWINIGTNAGVGAIFFALGLIVAPSADRDSQSKPPAETTGLPPGQSAAQTVKSPDGVEQKPKDPDPRIPSINAPPFKLNFDQIERLTTPIILDRPSPPPAAHPERPSISQPRISPLHAQPLTRPSTRQATSHLRATPS